MHQRTACRRNSVGRRVIMLAVALALLGTAGQVHARKGKVLIVDPLRGKTKGTLVGNAEALTKQGFVPLPGGATSEQIAAHILYDLPYTVTEGRIDVKMRGVDPASVPPGSNSAFVVQYDGSGITEPASYFEDFKQNFFRWNVHWRQNRNAMKAVLSLAAGSRERQPGDRAVYPGEEKEIRDFSEEPTGETVSWDPKRWHHLTIEWSKRVYTVSVDGVKRWQISAPHDYRPVMHRIWLGSGPGKYDNRFAGMMFRDFRLTGYRIERLRPKVAVGAADAEPHAN